MDAAHRLARQQAALAQLTLQALEPSDLGSVMQEVVELAARTLEVQHATVLEAAPDGGHVRLRAGVGWEQGRVGADAPSPPGGYVAYTLEAPEPVIVEDLRTERRFAPSSILLESGVRSSAAVRVPGPPGHPPYGVLGVHATEPRRFAPDEVEFLGGVAAALAGAIHRHRQAVELNDSILQTLVLARYALDRQEADEAAHLLDAALDGTRALVSARLGPEAGFRGPLPGDLRRTGAARLTGP